MRPQPRLSKSRYIAGLQCPRRLWLGWHDPEPRLEPQPGTILAVGTDVGVAARLLVPGGVLIDEGPEQHAEAVAQTSELIGDPAVLAIFEAAFAFDRVLIRADILERLPRGGWRLAEVKSTARVKPEHLHDLAIQAYVIAGCGLAVEEMQRQGMRRPCRTTCAPARLTAPAVKAAANGQLARLIVAVEVRPVTE